jgi:hypothetical protein
MSGSGPLLVRAILCLYPRQWRDRYQDEFARLLVDLLACAPRRARIRLIVNVVSGAADAHLNYPAGGAMTERIRRSLGVMICTLVVFAIAGAGFQKMTEDPAFTTAASLHSAIGTSFNVLRDIAFVAGIIVVIAAVPLVWALLRQAITRRQPVLVVWLVLPPVALATWIGVLKLIMAAGPKHPGVHSGANATELIAVVVLGLAAAWVCAWSTLRALRETELPARLLQAEVVPMIAIVACMAAITVTDLSWGLAVRAGDGSLFHSSNGLLATALPPSWLGGLVVLAAATIVAGRATVVAAGQLGTASAGGRPPANN